MSGMWGSCPEPGGHRGSLDGQVFFNDEPGACTVTGMSPTSGLVRDKVTELLVASLAPVGTAWQLHRRLRRRGHS